MSRLIDWGAALKLEPDLPSRLNHAFFSIEALLRDLRAFRTESETAAAALAARVTMAEGEIDALQAVDVALDARLDAAETDITALEGADVALDARLDTAETDINNLESSRVQGRGNGVANRLAYWTDANTVSSDGDGTFDGTDLTIADRLITSDPGTTLQTGLQVRANVAGTKTNPRIMMGPTANVGAQLIFCTFRGKNGTGACTAAALLIGDIVKDVQGIQPLHFVGSGFAGQYESTITVDGQIQQTVGTDFSGVNWLVIVERRSATAATTERPLYVVP